MTTATTGRRRSGGVPRRSRQTVVSREAALQRELTVERNNLELLEARLREAAGSVSTSEAGVVDLERAITQDPGWRLFSVQQAQEFSADGMTQLRAVCRLMAIANPLMKRGLELRRVYVHGQGCEIRARADGKSKTNDAEQDVRAVVDKFIRNRTNQKTVFGQQAAGELESALGTDGEVFIALFTKPRTGWVSARTFAADEITEVITNPDDRSEAWFYRRVWQRQTYDRNGHLQYEQQELLYPDIDYRPLVKPSSFAGVKIEWAAPVIQVAVNRPLNWLRGIPDAYAAINWTRAYKEFLEQWATLMKSLARFAWKLTTEGKNRAQARAALAQAGTARAGLDAGDGPAGGTALLPLNAQLEAIPKSGATIDAMSGRPIAMMAAAGLAVPVTMLLNDPGQTGARATAETLDWPTELTFKDRREIWSAVRLRICAYVIAEAVRAPRGPLKGVVRRDEATNEEVVELAGETDDTVDVIWPDLDDVEAKELIDGIVAANGTGTIPPELVLRHLLQALGVRDVDSILAEMVDEDGNFQWPTTAASAQQGAEAAALAAAGGDPAAAGPGLMAPDDDPDAPPGAPGAPGVPGQVGTAVVPADGPLAMQNDADFGLFGGTRAPAGTADQGPGEQPDVEGFDPDFYELDATAEDDTVTDEPPPAPTPARRRTTRTAPTREAETLLAEAAAAQGDADFGLGGSTTPAQRAAADRAADTAPAGEQPKAAFDPAFFAL